MQPYSVPYRRFRDHMSDYNRPKITKSIQRRQRFSLKRYFPSATLEAVSLVYYRETS